MTCETCNGEGSIPCDECEGLGILYLDESSETVPCINTDCNNGRWECWECEEETMAGLDEQPK